MLKLQNRKNLVINKRLIYGDRALAYSIRQMLKEDIAQVTEIDREAFPTQWPPANYRQELQNKLARYIVACDDTVTITEPEVKPNKGMAKLAARVKRWFNCNRSRSYSNDSLPSDKQYIIGFAGIWVLADEAHITNIAVRKQYQRRGLGELLLISTIDLAKELKASIMTLEVRTSNLTAQNLYSKYGFVQVGIRRGYYIDNREDGILMSTESITSAAFQERLQQLREALARKWGSQLMPEGNLSVTNPEN
jgi:ribosomal-protein-alanine N-acetyltransferase